MEWLRISTSTEFVRVRTDEIAYVRADGNYSDLVLINGKTHKMTFQLHFFDEIFQQLQQNFFVRVGRSLIVNKSYVYVINLPDQTLMFAGPGVAADVKPLKVSREALRQLRQIMENEKGGSHD